MPSSRSCRSSYDCIVKIKGVTMRPILFSQLMRSDGEVRTVRLSGDCSTLRR